MITESELYFLNRALDGEKIYGITPNRDMAKTFNLMESAKKNLINKKIINEDESLNDISFLILKNLEQYKKSNSYLWINDIVASIDESNYILFFKKEDEELEFKKTTKELMLYALVKEYKFMWECVQVDEQIEHVSLDDFIEKRLGEKNQEDILFIKREDKGKLNIYNIYYKENQDVFKYDVLEEELKKINPKDIRIELATILDIEVNL